MTLRKILALALIASFVFASTVYGQSAPWSTAAFQSWRQGVTPSGRMGVPRIPTASLPTCAVAHLGMVVLDTTTSTFKVCDGTTFDEMGDVGGSTVTGEGLIFKSSGAGTPTYFEVPAITLMTGADNFCLGTGSCAAITSGVRNVVIGPNTGDAFTDRNDNVLLGYNVGTGANIGNQNTCVGSTACDATTTTAAVSNTVVGYGAAGLLTTGTFNHCLGEGSCNVLTTGSFNVGVGFQAGPSVNSTSGSLSIGHNAQAAAANQAVIGGSTAGTRLTDWYLGGGAPTETSPPTSVTLQGTGGSGTDIAATDVLIAGGRGTGTGAGGDVSLRASPALGTGTTLQTLADRDVIVAKAKTLTDNSATTFLRVNIAADSAVIVHVFYQVDAENATDQQTIGGMAVVPIVNDAGAESCGTIVEAGEANHVSVGTITSVITCTGAGTNTIDLALTSDTSLNVSPLLTYRVFVASSAGSTVVSQ